MNFRLKLSPSLEHQVQFLSAVQTVLNTTGEGVAVGDIIVQRVEDTLVLSYEGRQVTYETNNPVDNGFWLNCEIIGNTGNIATIFDHTNDDFIEAAWTAFNWLTMNQFSTSPQVTKAS